VAGRPCADIVPALGHAEYDHFGVVAIGKMLLNRLISAVRVANRDCAAAVHEVVKLGANGCIQLRYGP